jgi:hypothetical protein
MVSQPELKPFNTAELVSTVKRYLNTPYCPGASGATRSGIPTAAETLVAAVVSLRTTPAHRREMGSPAYTWADNSHDTGGEFVSAADTAEVNGLFMRLDMCQPSAVTR